MQNLSLGCVERCCAIKITTTPQPQSNKQKYEIMSKVNDIGTRCAPTSKHLSNLTLFKHHSKKIFLITAEIK